MGDSSGATLQITSLVARRGRRRVLNGLSFEARPGVLAVLGPNGAGKSTLFRVITGLGRASSGRLVFDGVDATSRSGLRAVRGRLGYQPQTPTFTNGFTVRESLRYAAWLKGVGRREAEGRVERALTTANLTELARRPVRLLSGGQQKRTAIAQAIVHEPGLLVLDEPTAALDPTERRAVLDVVEALGHRSTVLMSTHITSDLVAATDVLVLDAGRARFTGTRADFGEQAADRHSDPWEAAYAAVSGAA